MVSEAIEPPAPPPFVKYQPAPPISATATTMPMMTPALDFFGGVPPYGACCW
ncbi:hypothetical protein ACU4GG_15540 [Streptomyces nojiriensis]